jgi:hypothetical protein
MADRSLTSTSSCSSTALAGLEHAQVTVDTAPPGHRDAAHIPRQISELTITRHAQLLHHQLALSSTRVLAAWQPGMYLRPHQTQSAARCGRRHNGDRSRLPPHSGSTNADGRQAQGSPATATIISASPSSSRMAELCRQAHLDSPHCSQPSGSQPPTRLAGHTPSSGFTAVCFQVTPRLPFT